MLLFLILFNLISDSFSSPFDKERATQDDVNQAPTEIFLSNNIFFNPYANYSEYNMFIGLLSTVDPNLADTHTYSLPSELKDNRYFRIVGNVLRVASLDKLITSDYEITIISSDGEFSIERDFKITYYAQVFPDVFSYGNEVINYRIVSVPTEKCTENEFIPGEWLYDPEWTGPYFLGERGVDYEVYDFHRVLGATVHKPESYYYAGTGYWFIVTQDYGDIQIPRLDAVQLNERGEFEMELQAGWNLIGNPFRENLNWDQELAYNIDAGFFQSEEVSKLYIYEGAYNQVSTLSVFQGAFVKAAKALTVYLRKPGYFTGYYDASSRQDGSSILASEGWQLDFVMSNKEQRTNLGGIGMNKSATEALDQYDIETPPPPSEKFAFHWEDELGLFRNIVNEQESYTWEYKVKTNDKELKLSWSSEVANEHDKDLWLEILPQHRFVNLKQTNDISFKPVANQRVKIYYGQMPEMYQADLFPNPAQNEVSISLTSSFEKDASITIVSMSGRQVFSDTRRITVGQNQWIWNLTGKEGDRLDPGLYFYRISVEGQGDQVMKVVIK